MALKLLKINVSLEVKADLTDPDDVRERVCEALQILIESDELEYGVDEDEEEVEDES